jgi:hypothetical protein
MLNIFIDEAGDQGFNFEKGSSRHFLIGFAFFPTTDYKDCVDSVKMEIGARGGIAPKHLHFNKSSLNVRRELLKKMVEKKGKFGYIYENKEKIYDYLRINHNIHYNYNQMAFYLIDTLIANEHVCEDVVVFISQRSSDKRIKKGIATYLSNRINKALYPHRLYSNFVKPHSSRGADCADFVCGSVYKMIEKNDSQYYEIIKNNIVVAKELFKR